MKCFDIRNEIYFIKTCGFLKWENGGKNGGYITERGIN